MTFHRFVEKVFNSCGLLTKVWINSKMMYPNKEQICFLSGVRAVARVRVCDKKEGENEYLKVVGTGCNVRLVVHGRLVLPAESEGRRRPCRHRGDHHHDPGLGRLDRHHLHGRPLGGQQPKRHCPCRPPPPQATGFPL